MKNVRLGKSGLKVSELAYGTMSFGGDADAAMAKKLFHRCLDAGINHFDCADLYSGGRAEEILGALLKGHREQVSIASKAYFPTGAGANQRGSSRLHIKRACEASLRRLGSDHIELYYLHRFDDEVAVEESMAALQQLVNEGKVLYLGLSNFAAWQVMKAQGVNALKGYERISCIQPMYNMVKRQAEVELLPMAQAEGMGVLPYSPLAAGLLSGKYNEGKRPQGARITEKAWYKLRYGVAGYAEVAEAFVRFAQSRGYEAVPLAIAWVGSHPGVTAPLIGARNLEQLELCLKAQEIEMTPSLREEISALSPTPPPATDRNEEELLAQSPHARG